MTLTAYGHAGSLNVQAVMWCIAELALPHKRYNIGHRFGGINTPEFITMNPNRLVPVLVDSEGHALWESRAILRYLANHTHKHHSGLLIFQNALRSTNGQSSQR